MCQYWPSWHSNCNLNREKVEHMLHMLRLNMWSKVRTNTESEEEKWHVTPSYCCTVNNIVFPGETVLTVWECRWEPAALCPSGIEAVDFRHFHLLWSETLKLLLGMRLSSFPTSDILITRRTWKHCTVLVHVHWSPVKYRIDFKIVLFVFKALHGPAPA